MQLSDFYAFKPLTNVYTNKHAPETVHSCPGLLYGVELEIEGVPYPDDYIVPGMSSKEDNSLRNDGREFITDPMTLPVLQFTLGRFFGKLRDVKYSERCSTHVHANCRDLTLDQIQSILLLYQIFENLLFQFVGEDRERNIFCVPWHQTTLTYNIINTFKSDGNLAVRKWQKYTAVNLLTLRTLGTLEFRHLHGTNDQVKIINWCNLIGCLFQYAKDYSLETITENIVSLNTTSAYRATIDNVFKQWADLLRTPDYDVWLEEGVLNMKYSLLYPEAVKKIAPKPKLGDIDYVQLDNDGLDRMLRDEILQIRPLRARPVERVAPGYQPVVNGVDPTAAPVPEMPNVLDTVWPGFAGVAPRPAEPVQENVDIVQYDEPGPF